MIQKTESLRLLELRKQLSMSQREFANEIKVTQAAIAMWEKGSRTIPGTVLKVIEIYEDSINDEIALTNRENAIRELSTHWAKRLLTTFSKGARAPKKKHIQAQLEKSLFTILKSEFSANLIKRNIQISLFNRIVQGAAQTKGLPVKLIQLLTYFTPGMSKEAKLELEQIHELQYPMPPTVVARLIYDNFGVSPQKLFAEWSPVPIAIASIGQVHIAKLKSGERVAVKIQYPEIQKALSSDLKFISFISNLASGMKPEIKRIMNEFRQIIMAETDYLSEAEYLEKYRDLLKDEPNMIIPKVYKEYTTKSVLTMDYIEGKTLFQFKEAPAAARRKAIETILRFSTITSFKAGLINSDVNAGNFIFCENGKIGFIDFGRCTKIDTQNAISQKDFLRAVIENDTQAAKKIVPKLSFIKNPEAFSFENFWNFFCNQQAHFRAGDFHFTHEYIRENAELFEKSKVKDDLKITLEMLWSIAITNGFWYIFAELDVPVNYGKTCIEAIEKG